MTAFGVKMQKLKHVTFNQHAQELKQKSPRHVSLGGTWATLEQSLQADPTHLCGDA